ncbi:hypothetical protein JXQ31_08770 [candidate division KSB1 bacterium]|nr:hypothetical protein [candidate division KSB1 bacterium]
MQEYVNISRIELEQKITNREVRPLRILIAGMFGCVFIFLSVILYMYNRNINNPAVIENQPYLFSILLAAMLFLAIPQYLLLFLLPRILLSPGKIKARLTQPVYYKRRGLIEDPVKILLLLYRHVVILRFSLLEGVAFYGLGILFLSVMNGAIYEQSQYWLALFPLVIMIIFGYLFFPSREKIIFYIENNMLNKIKNI